MQERALVRIRKGFLTNKKKRNRGMTPAVLGLESRAVPATGLVQPGMVAGEILVQYDKSINIQQRALIRTNFGGLLHEEIDGKERALLGDGATERVGLPDGASTDSAIAWFSRQSGVLFAEPNYLLKPTALSNDPYYTGGSRPWNMYGADTSGAVGPTGTTNAFGINAEAAWNEGFTGSKSVYVGILDTGVQINHPDLANNIWVNPYDPADGIDNDGNGYVDDTNGWDFLNNDNSVYDGSGDSHGTHVAGVIGGKGGNGLGVAGVNWNVSMITAKFMGANGGTTADAVKALDYLTDLKLRHGIDIVATNNSWGGGVYSESLNAAINRSAKADILFVTAAGNDATNLSTKAAYPASYSSLQSTSSTTAAAYDNVITVTSINQTGGLSNFANFGVNTVDLAAPGTDIYSTYPINGYLPMSGTSMAAPHVTGAVALYASKYPTATAVDIRNALLTTTTPTPALAGMTVTGGRLDVYNALKKAPASSVPVAASFAVTDVAMQESNTGTTIALFTVSLNRALTVPVSVVYTTADDTARAGEDYLATSGTLYFAPGVTSQTVQVPVKGDTTVETDERFTLNLSSNSAGTDVLKAQGVGRILNDDIPPPVAPSITVADTSVIEGNRGTSQMIFTLTRSGDVSRSSSVNFITTSGTAWAYSDFTPVSGTIVFAPGETARQIRVPVIGDTFVESNETLLLNLSLATNATLPRTRATGTILDDDSVQLIAQSQPAKNSVVAPAVATSPTTTVKPAFKPVVVPVVPGRPGGTVPKKYPRPI